MPAAGNVVKKAYACIQYQRIAAGHKQVKLQYTAVHARMSVIRRTETDKLPA
jgi:hypothetical protein